MVTVTTESTAHTDNSADAIGDRGGLPAVVTLAGARDGFQVPLAFSERSLLATLVTDLFWPTGNGVANRCLEVIAGSNRLMKRSCDGIDGRSVRISAPALAAFASSFVAPNAHWLNVRKGRALGALTRRVASKTGASAICYAGCAFEAFRTGTARPERRILFAMQADPRSRRSLLREEIDRLPAARADLLSEYECSLSQGDFEQLAEEPHLATAIVANSRYTASTLTAYGVPSDRIRIVPYGVNTEIFSLREGALPFTRPFTVAYVGRMTQSKGLGDLLHAVRLLRTRSIAVDIYTGTRAGEHMLSEYTGVNARLSVGLTGKALARALHAADILALPSLSDGFGHVILEAMACGLPVIATPHTCAPDVLTSGVHGFIVPIRDPQTIATRLEWAMDHRPEIMAMGIAASRQAAQFTWKRFRSAVAKAYLELA